jgi:hypothetical protein
MPRIELSNYGPIRELIIDGKPGFNPRGVSIIMGRSGAGKTLLANALYMEPVLTIEDMARKLGLHPALADAINIVKTIADLYGFRNYDELHASSRFSVCVEPSIAGGALFSAGYDPGTVEYACLTSEGGSPRVELVVGGRRIVVENPSMGLISLLILNASSIMSIPRQLRDALYMLDYEEVRGIYDSLGRIRKEVNDLTVGVWVDVMLKARVPPLVVGELDFRKAMAIETVVFETMIDYQLSGNRIMLTKPTGELEAQLLHIARDFTITTRGLAVKPLIYIDDVFGNTPTINAKNLVGIMRDIVVNGASLVLTTYRPDVIALDEPNVKGFIDDYVSLYITTYGLEPLAKHGPINDRLWLVSVDEMSEETYKRALGMLG